MGLAQKLKLVFPEWCYEQRKRKIDGKRDREVEAEGVQHYTLEDCPEGWEKKADSVWLKRKSTTRSSLSQPNKPSKNRVSRKVSFASSPSYEPSPSYEC